MSSDWYTASGNPGTKAQGSSAQIRAEFVLIQAKFGLLPVLTGKGGLPIFVNAGGTALESTSAADARTKLGLEIGTNVQAYAEVLQNTTASFTTELATKLGYITVASGVDLNALLPASVFGQNHNTSTGKHKAVVMTAQADPTLASGEAALYIKSFEGRPELYWSAYGQTPLRMTYNGGLQVEFSTSALTFGAVTSNSFFRAKRLTITSTSNAATVDASLAEVHSLTVTEDVEITITNLPSSESSLSQCFCIELINAGDYTVTFASSYDIEWVSSTLPTFTSGGKDRVMCVSNDGASITMAALLNIGAAS